MIAARILPRATATSPGRSTPSSRGWDTWPSFTGTTTTFTDLRTELDNGRPLGVRIGWSGGGGHFNVVSCYTWNLLRRGRTIQIEDPWYGTSVWDYDTFRTAYQGSGSWTHSYRTKA